MKEVILITGINAAGKTTCVQRFLNFGYTRLNRDEDGSSIAQIAQKADSLLNSNTNIIGLVIDNTYPSVASRKSIIDVAKKNGAIIKCVHLTTSFEDAQLNACLRMIKTAGKLLQPEDFKKNKNPNLFPPAALFVYRKEFQLPTIKEGFTSVDTVSFNRQWGPDYVNKALILDYDGTLRLSTGEQKFPQNINEIKILPGRTKRLKEYIDKNYILLGASNQSGIAKGVPQENVIKCFEETNRLLGVKIDYLFCPHRIPPVSCYCRKPHVGMGAWFIEKYKLKPSECIMVGDMTTDETFAKRCGFKYVSAENFF